MDLLYPFMLTIHLLCAITFGGAVIFEVLVLDSLHSTFSIETMHQIEGGIVKRAKKIMP